MRTWRLTLSHHRKDALKGLGAQQFSGRWNSVGTAMGYTSCSLELAVLERMVRVQPGKLPLDYIWIEYEIPDDAIASLDDLPARWDMPGSYRANVQAAGDEWISSQRSLALCVPAAVLPERQNILVNPAHARFEHIREVAAAPFTWPKRLAAYLESSGNDA